MAPIGLSFGLRMAVCIAQCLNLEREFHHTASKLCILGFEPLKQSLIACTLPIKLRGSFQASHVRQLEALIRRGNDPASRAN